MAFKEYQNRTLTTLHCTMAVILRYSTEFALLKKYHGTTVVYHGIPRQYHGMRLFYHGTTTCTMVYYGREHGIPW